MTVALGRLGHQFLAASANMRFFKVSTKLEEKSEKEEKSPDPHLGGTRAHQNQKGHLYPHRAGSSGAFGGGHVTEAKSMKAW